MIHVLRDDLAFVAADAVLRPSDAQLQPVSAIGVRLDQIAGPDFALLRRVREPLHCGAVVVTGGGELAAPFVVHCVVQDADSNADRGTLRRILVSAWQQADAWGLLRVATPPIGTGGGLLDLEEATTVLCETWLAARGAADRRLTIVVERSQDEPVVANVVARWMGTA